MESLPIQRRDVAFVVLVLRLAFGQLMLFAGINKFWNEGPVSNVSAGLMKRFEGTYLPELMLMPYSYALPYIEVVLGLVLLVGLFSRQALAVTALLLLSLAFGVIVLKDYPTAAANTVYAALAALAFLLARWDDFSADYVIFRRGDPAPLRQDA